MVMNCSSFMKQPPSFDLAEVSGAISLRGPALSEAVLLGYKDVQYLILKRYSGFANCGPGPLIMQAAPQQLVSQASLFH